MAGIFGEVYVLDTSFLINLFRRYPSTNRAFAHIWLALEGAFVQGRLLAPHEVYEEISRGADDIAVWARAHDAMFVEIDSAQAVALREIVRQCPMAAGAEKLSVHADPWTIALAKARDATVVSDETSARRPTNPRAYVRIPDVCHANGVRHISGLEFIERLVLEPPSGTQ